MAACLVFWLLSGLDKSRRELKMGKMLHTRHHLGHGVMVNDHNSCQLGCPDCRLLSPPSFSCYWNEFIFWKNVLIKGDSTHNVVVLYPVCFCYICAMVGEVDICWLVRNYHHNNIVWLKTKQNELWFSDWWSALVDLLCPWCHSCSSSLRSGFHVRPSWAAINPTMGLP